MYHQELGVFVTAVKTGWGVQLNGKANGREICGSGRKKLEHVFKRFMASNLFPSPWFKAGQQ